jgi:LysM repeat protein
MGSVRRSSPPQLARYIALNVIVSVISVLLVLAIWDRRPGVPQLPPTPTFDVFAQVVSAGPTRTPTIVPSPTPVTYTVQPGDSLLQIAIKLELTVEDLMAANNLTNPDSLAVGQVLVVPQIEGQRAAPTATRLAQQGTAQATVTGSPDGQTPKVEIRSVLGAGSLEQESLVLLNSGGVAPLAGWTVEDGEGHVYIFPAFTLHNGGSVVLHTGAGSDTVIDLYWGLDEAVWTSGKVASLRDAAGDVHSTFQIP